MKVFLILLLLNLAITPIMAKSLSSRQKAMGYTCIAFLDDMQNYINPASVFFNSGEKTFLIETAISDNISHNALPYLPKTDIKGAFTGARIALNIAINFASQNLRDDKAVDILQKTTLDINLSTGLGAFAVGVGISGGSVRKRLDVPMKSISDYAMQFFFSQYDRDINSEFMQIRAGFLFKKDQLSLGILLDDILDKAGDKTSLSMKSLFAHTGIGVYWSRADYSRRGKMNNFLYSFALDIDNLFNSDTRSINMGVELSFRAIRSLGLSLRAGFFALSKDLNNHTWTMGASLDIQRYQICIIINCPKNTYSSFEISAVVQL